MDHEQAIILALVQGITEFLPISSSSHLILSSQILGWADQGIRFDIAVHTGSLVAIMLYCWRDIHRMMIGSLHLCLLRYSEEARLTLFVVLASVPLMIAGYFLYQDYPPMLRDPAWIAATSAGFAVLLWLTDRYSMTLRDVHHLRSWTFLAIGMAQIFALLPGASRAGVVISMARLSGFGRQASAKIAFLLAIPALAGAGGLQGYTLWREGDLDWGVDMLVVAALGFIFSLIGVAVMMRWLMCKNYTPFVLYRLMFSAGIGVWLYFDRLSSVF